MIYADMMDIFRPLSKKKYRKINLIGVVAVLAL